MARACPVCGRAAQVRRYEVAVAYKRAVMWREIEVCDGCWDAWEAILDMSCVGRELSMLSYIDGERVREPVTLQGAVVGSIYVTSDLMDAKYWEETPTNLKPKPA